MKKQTTTNKTRRDIKQELVDLVVEYMEKNQRLPWDKGTFDVAPINATTGKAYNGINDTILEMAGIGTLEFATFKQIQAAGGKVKKGAKGLPVVYYDFTKWNKAENRKPQEGDNPKDIETIPFLKRYVVFNLEDTEGVKSHRAEWLEQHKKENAELPDAQKAIDTFIKATGITFQNKLGTACYSPATHSVKIAPREHYKNSDHYYQTLFHELIHSTKKAMGRKQAAKQGDEIYSQEEIVAEFGSMILCRTFGVKPIFENSAEYIRCWGTHIKANPNWLITGANQAEKAAKYFIDTVKNYKGGKVEKIAAAALPDEIAAASTPAQVSLF